MAARWYLHEHGVPGSRASTVEAVRSADAFAVHLLTADQEPIARRFALSNVDRFFGVRWSCGPDQVPILDGVAAWLVARAMLHQVVGDHLLVVGQVTSASEDRRHPC